MKPFWFIRDAAFERTADWIIKRNNENGLFTNKDILQIGCTKSWGLKYRVSGGSVYVIDSNEVPVTFLIEMTPDLPPERQRMYRNNLTGVIQRVMTETIQRALPVIRDYVAQKKTGVKVSNKNGTIQFTEKQFGIAVLITVSDTMQEYSGEELLEAIRPEIDTKLETLSQKVDEERTRRHREELIRIRKDEIAVLMTKKLSKYGCKVTAGNAAKPFVLNAAGTTFEIPVDAVPAKKDWNDIEATADAYVDYILSNTLECSLWSNSKLVNRDEGLRWIQENLVSIDRWLEPGRTRVNTPQYSYNVKEQTTILRVSNIGDIHLKNGKVVATKFTKQFDSMVKDRGKKTYQSCKAYATDLAAELGLSVVLKSGNPILYGPATLSITCSDLSLTVPCNTGVFSEGVRAWKAEVKRCFTEAADSIREIDEQRKTRAQEEFNQRFGRMGEDFLVCDILEFVQANDRCITETAIGQALHGNAVSLRVSIQETAGMGRYTYYSVDEIRSVVRQMQRKSLLYAELLEGGSRRNRYTFEALHVADNVDISAVRVEALPFRETMNRFKEGKKLTDAEAAILWKHMQGLKKTPANMEKILTLAHATGFLCRYEAEILEYFSGLDKDNKALLKMQAALEDDESVKKLIRKILKQA